MQAVQLHPIWSKIGLLSCAIKLSMGLTWCFLTVCIAGVSITESTFGATTGAASAGLAISTIIAKLPAEASKVSVALCIKILRQWLLVE